MVEPSGDASIAEVAALADADPIKSIVGFDEEEERTFEETIEVYLFLSFLRALRILKIL